MNVNSFDYIFSSRVKFRLINEILRKINFQWNQTEFSFNDKYDQMVLNGRHNKKRIKTNQTINKFKTHYVYGG